MNKIFVAVAIKDNIYIILSKPCTYEEAKKFKNTQLTNEKFAIVTLKFLKTLHISRILGIEYLNLKTNTMNIKKTTVNLYKITFSKKHQWADIIIDNQNKSGRIIINSSWGNWDYYCDLCETTFKQFLITLKNKKEEVAYQLREEDWFDYKATIINLKKQVINDRRNNLIDEVMVGRIYNEILEIENNCSGTIEDFYKQYGATYYLHVVYDSDFIKTISPEFEMFWQEAFLPFIQYLEQEVENEN